MGKGESRKESLGTFMSCSDGKDLTCYYCIGCNTIQHRSCLERRKVTIFLSIFRIFYNNKCEEKAMENINDEDYYITTHLRQIIQELHTETTLKTNAIEKRRRYSIS